MARTLDEAEVFLAAIGVLKSGIHLK
jgi:hypothetical protein